MGGQGTSGARVRIVESGRTGTVVYEGPSGSLPFYWEFGGSDVIAIVQVSDAAAWRTPPAWLAGREADVLRYVAEEVIRQKAPSCRAEIEVAEGRILLRQGAATAGAAGRGFSYSRYRDLRARLALVVLVVAGTIAAMGWFRNRVLTIDPGPGTAVGESVRTETLVATLIQTLEPYTPSLNRNHGNDTYRYSLLLVPLDGAAPRRVAIGGGFASTAVARARILGSDGRVLWFDVNGVGGLDLEHDRLLPAGQAPPAGQPLQGAPTSPFPLRPEAFLAAGLFTSEDTWLGLHSEAELARHYQPRQTLRRVVSAEERNEPRRFYRGQLQPLDDPRYHRVVAMTPLGTDEFLSAALLRLDAEAEPLRLSAPDGALMLYTSAAGLKGTLVVARIDTAGQVLWRADTGIDRYKLSQLLPGPRTTVFIGPRPAVPDKVSEPLLVIVDNASGKTETHSLWQ